MKTISITLYKFSELSDEAKQNAIEKLSTINVDYDWWDITYQDAKNIGLEITSFDLERNRHTTGKFITSAGEVVEKILSEHGKDCETYKTALRYKHAFQLNSGECNEDELENSENEFLNDLLHDYSMILQNECDYLQSEMAIIETIEANDYDFTENGELYNSL